MSRLKHLHIHFVLLPAVVSSPPVPLLCPQHLYFAWLKCKWNRSTFLVLFYISVSMKTNISVVVIAHHIAFALFTEMPNIQQRKYWKGTRNYWTRKCVQLLALLPVNFYIFMIVVAFTVIRILSNSTCRWNVLHFVCFLLAFLVLVQSRRKLALWSGILLSRLNVHCRLQTMLLDVYTRRNHFSQK